MSGCAGVITDTMPLPVPGEKVFAVTSDPLGANVLLDGRGDGVTPKTLRWSPLLAATGRATVVVKNDGYLDATVTFDFYNADPVVSKSAGVTISRTTEYLRDVITIRATLRPTEMTAYQAARAVGTVPAYERFLSEYPEGVLAGEARGRVAEILFTAAAAQNTSEAYRQFLADPRADASPRNRSDAQRQIERLTFEATRRRDTHAAYRRFIAEYGERSEYGGLAAEALRRIEADYLQRMTAGASLSLQGSLDEAISEYQEAMRLWPERPEPQHALAVIHLERGDFSQAEHSIQGALLREPSSSVYQRLLERIRQSSP